MTNYHNEFQIFYWGNNANATVVKLTCILPTRKGTIKLIKKGQKIGQKVVDVLQVLRQALGHLYDFFFFYVMLDPEQHFWIIFHKIPTLL